MAVSYTEKLDDLPRVAVPDWELLERLEELLEPYRGGEPFIQVWDSRSEYGAGSVEELRALIEAQGAPPKTIRFGFSGPQVESVVVYTSTFLGSGGHVYSADEATVNQLAARIRDVFALAPTRLEPEPPLVEREATFWERHGTRIERWALAIVPGLILLGIGTLVGLWIAE